MKKRVLAAGNMPDIYAFGPDSYASFKDYLTDLSNQSWVKDTDYAFKVSDGKVYGFLYHFPSIKASANDNFNSKWYLDLE